MYLKVHPAHLVPTELVFRPSYRNSRAAGELRGASRDASLCPEGWRGAWQSWAPEMRSFSAGDKFLGLGGQTRRTKPLRL